MAPRTSLGRARLKKNHRKKTKKCLTVGYLCRWNFPFSQKTSTSVLCRISFLMDEMMNSGWDPGWNRTGTGGPMTAGVQPQAPGLGPG